MHLSSKLPRRHNCCDVTESETDLQSYLGFDRPEISCLSALYHCRDDVAPCGSYKKPRNKLPMWGWDWLFDPKNAATVSALGFVLAVVGFPITLIQLWRTKKSADSAKEAADSVALRINSFGAMRECEQARSQARRVNDAVAAGDWELALIKYQDVAVGLTHLAESNVTFDDGVAASLQEAIKRIDENCNVIERALKTDPNKISKGKQFSALRPIDTVIAKTMFNLERLSSS